MMNTTCAGRRRVDCIGRWESGRAHGEIASQFQGIRITPNLYTTLSKLDRFCEQMELIARKGLPS
jgi:hypothetical protein